MLILFRRSFNNKNMRIRYTMEYYSSFPRAIFQKRVDCIRVTHPCATRHQKQAFMLPFDLHVLSLPLAFILSQDQTLRCNYKFNIVLGFSIIILYNRTTMRVFPFFFLLQSFQRTFDLLQIKTFISKYELESSILNRFQSPLFNLGTQTYQ